MSRVTVYVPADAGALAVGAQAVAQTIIAEACARNLDIQVVRNGSRGLYWLETARKGSGLSNPQAKEYGLPVSRRTSAGFLPLPMSWYCHH